MLSSHRRVGHRATCVNGGRDTLFSNCWRRRRDRCPLNQSMHPTQPDTAQSGDTVWGQDRGVALYAWPRSRLNLAMTAGDALRTWT